MGFKEEVLAAAARGAHAIQKADHWFYRRDDGELAACDTAGLLALRYYETEHGIAHDWYRGTTGMLLLGVAPCKRCGTILTEANQYSCCPGAHD